MSAEIELKNIISGLNKSDKTTNITLVEESHANKIVIIISCGDDNEYSVDFDFDSRLDGFGWKKLYAFRQDAYVSLLGLLAENFIRNEIKKTSK